MVEKRKFTVNVQNATERGYSGRCLELPGAISEGETLKELKANMKEAILLVLESIKKDTESDDKLVIEISS